MTTDVLESWKKNRFVVADSDLTDIDDANIIILTEIGYWNDHYDELQEWCDLHNASIRGMTVACDDRTLTAFALRWS